MTIEHTSHRTQKQSGSESALQAWRAKAAERKAARERLATSQEEQERLARETGKRTLGMLYRDYTDVPENYELITSDKQPVLYRDTSGKKAILRNETGVWTDRYVREEYIQRTDHLIGIIDGSITLRNEANGDISDERIPEGESHIPDVLLCLDKSARPVADLVDAFWEQFAEPSAKKPENVFLNIDRENWFTHMGHTQEEAASRLGREDFNIDDVQQERIDAIRALFVSEDISEENWRDEIWKMPTRLDGKHMLIVDEVKNKGGTLYMAVELLRRAIPEMTVDGTYFWKEGRISIDGVSASSDSQQMASAPLWYNKQNPYGRGVGDISNAFYNHQYEQNPNQQTLRNKLASFALSAPHHDHETFELKEDNLYKKLRQDISYLTYDVADGHLFRLPSSERDTAQRQSILTKQGLSPQEARTAIQERGSLNRDK